MSSPEQIPKALSLEQIPKDLEMHEAAARQRMSRSGATVGWFCATVLLFDIVLNLNRQPGPTVAIYRLVRDAVSASSRDRLDSYAWCVVVVLQLSLALGILALRGSPWRIWARQSLRSTRPDILLQLLIKPRTTSPLFATQDTEHDSTYVSRKHAATDLIVQLLALGLLLWATASMVATFDALKSLPAWLWYTLHAVRWVGVVLGAWLVSAVLRRISHTGTLVGIATGFLCALALSLLSSQQPDTAPAVQHALEISFWVSALVSALVTTIAAAPSLDTQHDKPRETVVGPGFLSVPFLPISKRDGRLVYHIKYACDLGNSGVLILRDDGHGKHMLEPRKPILSPFSFGYDILNLSAVAALPAMTLSIDTPGELYRFHLSLSVNSVSNAHLKLHSSSGTVQGLESRVVQVYLDVFFRQNSRSRDLDKVLGSILRDWFRQIECDPGTWSLRAGNLEDLIRNVQAKAPIGADLSADNTGAASGMKRVGELGDSPVESRRHYLIVKAEMATAWLRELETLRTELRRLDTATASALETLGNMFTNNFATSMNGLLGDSDEPSIVVTSKLLSQLFDVRLQDVRCERMPGHRQCDERLAALSQLIVLDRDFDEFVGEQGGREQKLIDLIHAAVREGVGLREIIGGPQLAHIFLPTRAQPPRVAPDETQRTLSNRSHPADEV